MCSRDAGWQGGRGAGASQSGRKMEKLQEVDLKERLGGGVVEGMCRRCSPEVCSQLEGWPGCRGVGR